MAGASSIQGGITISFANLNGISLNGDKSIASVGAGNIWGEVFESLATSDRTVVGGRLFNIGVGGLTTGGMSHSLQRRVMDLQSLSANRNPDQAVSRTSLPAMDGPVTM